MNTAVAAPALVPPPPSSLRVTPSPRFLQLSGPLFLSAETGCSLEAAAEISALFDRAYGARYHQSVTNDPSSVKRSIEQGSWVACVYRDDASGGVVAHGALLRSGDQWRLARVLVDQSARGLGLGDKLTVALLGYADSQSDEIASPVVTESVTAHHGTQKIFAEVDFVPLGLLVSKFNDYFNTGHRESAVLMGRAVTTKAERVFVPSSVAPLVEEIFRWHNITTGVKTGDDRCGTQIGTNLPGAASFAFDSHMSIARISVGAAADIHELTKLIDKAREEEAIFTELKVEVSTPDGYALSETAISQGFVFAGIEPHRNGVWLILQSGEGIAERAAHLNLFSPEARRLQEFIAAC